MASLADLTPPIPLGALDGRYRSVIAPLVEHLSEPALNRYRLYVEIEWLIFLAEHQVVPGAGSLNEDEQERLRAVLQDFGADEIAELAAIEAETVHDVKAIEYFLKRRLADLGRDDLSELVHFACTSEDVNNLSYALMVSEAVTTVWLPAASEVVDQLAGMARDLAEVPLLAHTHGQPATPTTMGKELAVLAHRLRRQLRRVEGAEYLGKLNGATGTYGAHLAAVPDADWTAISEGFVTSLGLTWNPLTTQIESHDWQAEVYADIARFNRILHNLCTDVWTYISLGYFAQVRGQGTVGSSTMPHKVNPIRFENAEANLEVSNALLDVLATTLVTSRLQRDLTDSSMQRNIGTALGHSLLALSNVGRGLSGLDAVPEAMAADLNGNWEVLAEPIQSAMRALAVAGHPGMDNPYERLKELTRGRRINGDDLVEFVRGLGLPDEVEERLVALTPADYTGIAARLVDYLDAEGVAEPSLVWTSGPSRDERVAGMVPGLDGWGVVLANDFDAPLIGVLLREHGVAVVEVRLGPDEDARAAQREIARALRLPDPAATNLDAFGDTLSDLAQWWPGHEKIVLLLHGVHDLIAADLPGWITLQSILDDGTHRLSFADGQAHRLFETVALVEGLGVTPLADRSDPA